MQRVFEQYVPYKSDHPFKSKIPPIVLWFCTYIKKNKYKQLALMLTCMMMETVLGIIKPLSYNKANILILLVSLLLIVTVISQLSTHPLFFNKQRNNSLPLLVIECVHIHYHFK